MRHRKLVRCKEDCVEQEPAAFGVMGEAEFGCEPPVRKAKLDGAQRVQSGQHDVFISLQMR